MSPVLAIGHFIFESLRHFTYFVDRRWASSSSFSLAAVARLGMSYPSVVGLTLYLLYGKVLALYQ